MWYQKIQEKFYVAKDGYDFRTVDKKPKERVQATNQEACCYCIHSESIL